MRRMTEEGGRELVKRRMEKERERSEEEDRKEGGREVVRKRMVRKVVRRTTTLINFPRQCLQWFLKIDQSECSKSPINLHQRNSTCVVPPSEHPQS